MIRKQGAIRSAAILVMAGILFAGCLDDPILTQPKTDMVTDTTKPTPDMKGGDGDTSPTDIKKDTKPLCDTGHPLDNTCVDCIDDSHCTAQLCNTDTNTCVDCLENTTCTKTNASKCDNTDTHTCIACIGDTDCEHLTKTPRCDAGTCAVQCTDKIHCTKMDEVCDLYAESDTYQSCIKQTTKAGQCSPCKNDEACRDGFHCIALNYKGNPHGAYCLETVTHAMACPQPYQFAINRESLNGAAAEPLCGIVEDYTSCEAIQGAGTDCKKVGVDDMGDDTLCLSEGKDFGGICKEVGASNFRCTYKCNSPEQCEEGKTCDKSDGTGFCK